MSKPSLEERLSKARDRINKFSIPEMSEDVVVHRCRNGALALKLRSHSAAVKKQFLLSLQEYKEIEGGLFKGGCFCVAFNPNSEPEAPNVQEVLDAIDAIAMQKPYDRKHHANIEIVEYDRKHKTLTNPRWKDDLKRKLKESCDKRRVIDLDLIFHSNLFLSSSGVIKTDFVKEVAEVIRESLAETSVEEVNVRLIGCNSYEISEAFCEILDSTPNLGYKVEATRGVCYVEMYSLYISKKNLELLAQDPKVLELKAGQQISICHLLSESQQIIKDLFANPLAPKSSMSKPTQIPLVFDNMLTFTSRQNPPQDVAQNDVFFDGAVKTFFTSFYKKLLACKKGLKHGDSWLIAETSRLPDELTTSIPSKELPAHEVLAAHGKIPADAMQSQSAASLVKEQGKQQLPA